jgi:drug/metabolite transporter (DMT)-like permease
MPQSASLLGWAALMGMILSSSTYYSLAKELTVVLTPLALVLFSEALTAIFVLLSFGLFPAIKSLSGLSKAELLSLLVVGVLSSIVAPALLFAGLSMTSAVNATLFGNTEMLFLLLLSVLFMGERLRLSHSFSLLFIGAGVLCIALRGFTESVVLRPGDMLILLSSLIWAGSGLLFRKFLHDVPVSTVVLTRAVIAVWGISLSFLFSPAGAVIAQAQSLTPDLLVTLLAFAFLSRFLTVFCFYQSLDRLPVSTVSVFNNFAVIGSIAFAFWYLGEPLQTHQAVGAALILTGTILLEALNGYHPTHEHRISHLVQKHMHRA